jgi:hypothetical protein
MRRIRLIHLTRKEIMKIIMRRLMELTRAVLAIKRRSFEKARKARQREIFVIIEAGMVHQIINLPPNLHVTVIDYDVESIDDGRLEISPVDGELCFISKW